jgi:hypothetical protein
METRPDMKTEGLPLCALFAGDLRFLVISPFGQWLLNQRCLREKQNRRQCFFYDPFVTLFYTKLQKCRKMRV